MDEVEALELLEQDAALLLDGGNHTLGNNATALWEPLLPAEENGTRALGFNGTQGEEFRFFVAITVYALACLLQLAIYCSQRRGPPTGSPSPDAAA